MNHKEKHIKQILTGEYTKDGKPLIKNENHLETVRIYVKLRKKVDRVKTGTLNVDLISIMHLSTFLKDKRFQDATRDDMMDFSTYLEEEKGFNPSSASLYLMKIKRFYKFVSEPDIYANGKMDQRNIQYPTCVRWISEHKGDELPIDSIPSKKVIKKLFNSCKDVRDQVILTSFLDGGLRRGELINLTLKNVGYDPDLKRYYFLLPKKTRGLKTGMRKVQLFLLPSSSSYIRDYLNHHRFKDNPNAPFIYTECNRIHGDKPSDFKIGEVGIFQIIDRIVNTSGVNLHITPHTLRHVSATWCAMKGFNESMLRERFGWSPSSRMPARYVHIANTDMKEKIMNILGIKKEETDDTKEMQPIICWNCEEENPFSYHYCFRCGADLKQDEKEISKKATAVDTGITVQSMMDKDEQFKKQVIKQMAREWAKLQQEKQNSK